MSTLVDPPPGPAWPPTGEVEPGLPLQWTDHPDNPLLGPPFPEPLLADPCVLLPADSPDGQWHLFAHGVLRGVHHYVGEDGVRWRRVGRVRHGLRPYLVRAPQGDYHLFYEQLVLPLGSRIVRVRSTDLQRFSPPEVVLAPTLPWEGRRVPTCGNPCVLPREGGWWLYYSAAQVWLPDCSYPEPRHIGLARATSLEGPFEKLPAPLISPSPAVPHRNLGAGAMKVIPDLRQPASQRLWGFTNGIYTDLQGRSRSDIRLLLSDDGLSWREAWDQPLLAPAGPGWKRALVYALDVRRVGDALWMYYNARDGWRVGRERIGLATCPLSP
ncbi:MAG: glycosyl hydrolase family 43 [Myxococcota bacterium]|jgi:hypothetical protein|nr:glycosyl hydrolase family 43 [Myxococcota bacterium]